MSNSEQKISESISRSKYPESDTAQELLSVSSTELSPDKSKNYLRARTGQSYTQSRSNNFDYHENSNSKTITRTNTRGFSGVELESDSIYKGKMLGLEHKELSGAETTSQKHESTLIDKEVKGELRKSLAIPGKNRKDKMYRVKTSLTLSEDRRVADLFDPVQTKYLSSGDFSEKPVQQIKKVYVNEIENIDEESGEGTSGRRASRTQPYSVKEHELRDAFIENLREMVTGVFKDLKQELQDSSEIELIEILKERERTTSLMNKFESNGLISEKANELLKEQDQMVVSLSNLLGAQLKQGNKVKGMLIDTLMFLDKQVLEMSKIQRIMDYQRRNLKNPTIPYLPQKINESVKLEASNNLDLENVTDSWVDRHSLLQKEMQAALNLEREKLESPTGNPLVTFASSGNLKKDTPKYMRSMNPLKWMSKLFKTESEKQKILNKKREKQGLKKNEKEHGSISTRNYPMKNEIRYNSYSYRFEKKSIFSMPHLGLFAEKYKLKPKNDKGKKWGSFMKNRKTKNFVKKNKEFKDEISGKEEKKRMKEELVKGKRKEKIKAVQSMCTSAIQNITDSNLVILKTRSGQEIKTKTCLDEVKQILNEFRKDLRTKQSRMRENNEDILELRCSVKRLESDIKKAQGVSGKLIDTRAKEAEIEHKTAQINSLEETNNTLFDEIKNLTTQIENLKLENENNLKEVTKVVKRKFREIESRNKHERQVQKDIILKYNVELESKNSEINELIGRYQEMRLLNEDLSREICKVKKNKKRSKSNFNETKSKKFNFKAQANIQRKKSRSRLAEEQLARRINISESAIMKLISNFENSLKELEEELRNEGLRVDKLSKEKEETKKQLYNLEKRLNRKKKEYQQSKGRGDLKNQLIQLEVTKSNKSKSLESKHRMLKIRKDLLRKTITTVDNVKEFGKKMINSTMEQIRSIVMIKDELKKKDIVIEDYIKKEKFLARVNELKEEKLSNKTLMIEKLNTRISILENELIQNKKFRIIRDKSSHTKKEFMIRKTKKNHSTNNFENFTKKKLYHHSNKTGSHTNFYSSTNKFMSETLGSIKHSSRKAGKSAVITKRKLKQKNQNREEISERYATRIKNNYKNILNDMKSHKKNLSSSKSTSRVNNRSTAKKRESTRITIDKYDRVVGELKDLKIKFGKLEQKYMDTHNDLLRSNNSIKVEALRYKKKSERNLKDSLRMINESQKIGDTNMEKNEKNKEVEMVNKSINVNTLTETPGRSREVSLLAEKLIMNNNINVSELHKLAVDEVYATNSSVKNTILNESLKGMKNQNKEMLLKFKTFKKKLTKLKNTKIKEKLVTKIESYDKKIDIIENKLEKFRMKLANDKLKESLNLYEMNLGDDVIDTEKKNLINKIKNVKGDLEIEQSNNVSLRAKILEKEEEIKVLKEEIEKSKMGDKKLVTDEDLIQKNLELTKKVEELEKKKADADLQMVDIRKRFKYNFNKMRDFESKIEDLEKNLETMSSTNENQRNQLKEKEEEIKKILQEKGKDPEQEKNVEDYQKDLAMENKESERLNSLLEEERYKVKELQKKIMELQGKLNQALTNEEKTKIQLNLTSQQLRNQDRGKNLLDARVEKPSEMRPQGRGEILSFRQIDRAGLQNKLSQMKSKSDLENQQEFKDNSNSSINNTSDAKAKKSVNDSDMNSGNPIFLPNPITENTDNIPLSNTTTLVNINNINYTTINMINPSTKEQEQRTGPETKNSDILENTNEFTKNTDFMSKLNKSFDVKSKDEGDSSQNNNIALPEFKPEVKQSKKDNKSDFQRLYIDSNMSDSEEDSSITSMVQKKSPRNSGADHHKKILEKFEMQIKSSPRADKIKMKIDLNPLPKDHKGNTGNMIVKNPKKSVNSVTDEGRNSSISKNLTKSLFALKTMSNENNDKFQEGGSLNEGLMEKDKASVDQDESDSFDHMFGEKKEMGSGVFSNREISAFEEDKVLEQMMKDEVEVGETAIAYSQRIISQNQKGQTSKKPNENKGVKKEEKKDVLEPPKNKNLFDQSFQNDSVLGFASNQKEQSLLMVPGQVLNNDHSFAGDKIFNTNHSFGGDRNAFISGKSFGTSDVINLLDKIKMDEESKEKTEIVYPKENPIKKNNNLMIVPEEGIIEDDFNFELPKKLQQNMDNINKFDSTNSLNLFGDLPTKPKTGDVIDPSIFGTDNFDQQTFNQVFRAKEFEQEKETEKQPEPELEPVSPPSLSHNESEDEMMFEIKFNKKSDGEDN